MLRCITGELIDFMGLSEDAIREQVDRLLASSAFRYYDVQRRLLSYLTEKSLAGEAHNLKEYALGVDVLGKPETYDPRRDSSVRFQVGKLRQRISEYYGTEGRADPVVVDLPKGHFEMSFRLGDNVGAPQERSGGLRLSWRIVVVAAIALATSTAAAWYYAVAAVEIKRAHAPVARAWSAELEALWSPFLAGGRPITVCIGEPFFIHFPDAHAFVRLPAAYDWEQARTSPSINKLLESLRETDPIPWHSFTGVGEARAAFLLGKLLGTVREDVLVTASSRLSWDQIVAHNVIFLGPPKYNPQLRRIPISQEFVFEDNGIRNLHPEAGEPAYFPDEIEKGSSTRDTGETHGLISRLPGPHRNAQMLILSGNWTVGTMGATQYMTQPQYARDLVSRIRLPSGQLPEHYQVVVKVSFNAGVPVRVSYLNHRVLQADQNRH